MARSSRPPPQLLPTVILAAVTGLAAAVAPASQAAAQALCSEPVKPICATTIPATDPSAATDQGVARNRCLDDMETYRGKLTEYRDCLQGSVAYAEGSLKAAATFVRCLQDGEPECRLGAPPDQ